MKYSLTIAWLYPDLMSTYGDRGNIICLKKRCQWRGIRVNVIPITLETQNSVLGACDLIFMGGAQDRQQSLAGKDFIQKKGPRLKKLIDDGIPGLFICAAYQAVGKYYKPYTGDIIPGLGIFDLHTIHHGDQSKRLIGNVVAELIGIDIIGHSGKRSRVPDGTRRSASRIGFWTSQNDDLTKIVGFENHGGRTYLGKGVKPFARVKSGFGNNGTDGFEGAIYKNCIGSYFHGPILPKNPHLADYLIAKALKVKYKRKMKLATLDDSLEWKANNYILNNY